MAPESILTSPLEGILSKETLPPTHLEGLSSIHYCKCFGLTKISHPHPLEIQIPSAEAY